jgi:hypothetical protein
MVIRARGAGTFKFKLPHMNLPVKAHSGSGWHGPVTGSLSHGERHGHGATECTGPDLRLHDSESDSGYMIIGGIRVFKRHSAGPPGEKALTRN